MARIRASPIAASCRSLHSIARSPAPRIGKPTLARNRDARHYIWATSERALAGRVARRRENAMNAIATLPPGTADATVCVASVASPLGPMHVASMSAGVCAAVFDDRSAGTTARGRRRSPRITRGRIPTGVPPRRQSEKVGALSLWDLQGSYSGFRNVKLTLGVKNLFDRDPPRSNQQNSFILGFDPSYYDPRRVSSTRRSITSSIRSNRIAPRGLRPPCFRRRVEFERRDVIEFERRDVI